MVSRSVEGFASGADEGGAREFENLEFEDGRVYPDDGVWLCDLLHVPSRGSTRKYLSPLCFDSH